MLFNVVSILWKHTIYLAILWLPQLDISNCNTIHSKFGHQRTGTKRGFFHITETFLTSFELFSSANFIVSRNTCWNRMRHRSNYLVIRRCDYFAHFNSKSLSNVSLVCSGLLYLNFSISKFFSLLQVFRQFAWYQRDLCIDIK